MKDEPSSSMIGFGNPYSSGMASKTQLLCGPSKDKGVEKGLSKSSPSAENPLQKLGWSSDAYTVRTKMSIEDYLRAKNMIEQKTDTSSPGPEYIHGDDKSEDVQTSLSVTLSWKTETDDGDSQIFEASPSRETTLEDISLSTKRLFLAHLLFHFYRQDSFQAINTTTQVEAETTTTASKSPETTGNKDKKSENPSSKRKQRNNITEDENANDNNARKRQKKPPPPFELTDVDITGNIISSDLFACPFYKRKPLEYAQCEKHVLRAIYRVKEHLWRHHRIPINCASCHMTFKKEEEHQAHQRQRPPCDLKDTKIWDGITKEQEEIPHKRSRTKATTAEQWYNIYTIIFPASPLPDSPYIDRLKSQQLIKLQKFMAQEWPVVFNRLMSDHIPKHLKEHQDIIEPFMDWLFQTAVSVILQPFDKNKSKSQSESSPDSGYGPTSATDLVEGLPDKSANNHKQHSLPQIYSQPIQQKHKESGNSGSDKVVYQPIGEQIACGGDENTNIFDGLMATDEPGGDYQDLFTSMSVKDLMQFIEDDRIL